MIHYLSKLSKLSNYSSLITLQGFPTAMVFDGISFVTTLPAPMTTLLPIVTPLKTVTFPPNQTLFPTVIGFAYSIPLFRVSASKGCSGV